MTMVTAFPAVRIETGRLVVREYGPGDAVPVTVMVAAQEWTALPPGAPHDPAGVWRWLTEDVHRFRASGIGAHLAIQEADTGAAVGAMSLFKTDWRRRCTEVGYGVRASVRGRGYVTEALTALTGWALSEGGMHRVELRTEPGNAASRRVAEKAGYTLEGTVADPLSGEEMVLFSRSRPAVP
jgi:RimJ/RimL family protein N-acetyltransferase